MKTIPETIAGYLSKKLELTLSGTTDSLYVIDWKNIAEEHEKMMEETEEMSDEEMGEFLIENESKLMQITENFMNDACDEKVEDDKWLPFALLGLGHQPTRFSEIKNNGLLLLDMTKANPNNPAVILFKNGKAQTIADSLDQLMIKEV